MWQPRTLGTIHQSGGGRGGREVLAGPLLCYQGMFLGQRSLFFWDAWTPIPMPGEILRRVSVRPMQGS
ncbi:hypothetical protein MPNT_320018 [Candidatus Methylacidithermus pantelleriae]|uniref:Uncharacterized protein n=1 Tax=Candidatus Methylacidithermus pantelleriae TaxID=2744239 RepID=A0A8J2FWL7_9BACT|nr:hypothetical protein MPNT_320018 [Candidatus Methylacidithermus pantelleriae]